MNVPIKDRLTELTEENLRLRERVAAVAMTLAAVGDATNPHAHMRKMADELVAALEGR